MNKLAAIVLIVFGCALIYLGGRRGNSLAGASEAAGKEIASKIDGEPRFPTQTLYLASGVILIVIGGAKMIPRQLS